MLAWRAWHSEGVGGIGGIGVLFEPWRQDRRESGAVHTPWRRPRVPDPVGASGKTLEVISTT